MSTSHLSHPIRLSLRPFSCSLLLGVAVAVVAAGCAVSSTDDESSESSSSVVGGVPSAMRAVVVVADADDRYACTGTLIAPDVVLMNTHCVSRAKAVYVGFSAPVRADEALRPLSGGAQRIALADARARTWIGDGVVRLTTPASTFLPVASTPPALDEACTVVGYGQDRTSRVFGKNSLGVQRAATMMVKRVDEWGVLATGVNGSPELGEQYSFLVCNDQLVGPKLYTETLTDDGTKTTAHFRSYGLPGVQAKLDAAVAELARQDDGI